MSAAINAALLTCEDEEGPAKHKALYVALLDDLYDKGVDSPNHEVVKQAAIAGIVSVLLRGPAGSELQERRKLSPEKARRRIARAMYVHSNIVELPAIAREVGLRLLRQLPEETDTGLTVRVIQGIDPKSIDIDFRPYLRLLEPISLGPAPQAQALGSLTAEFPWMGKVTESIVRELKMAAYCGRKEFRLRPGSSWAAQGWARAAT
jgi:hypothetical protein